MKGGAARFPVQIGMSLDVYSAWPEFPPGLHLSQSSPQELPKMLAGTGEGTHGPASNIHILPPSFQPTFSQDWSTTEGKLGLGLQFQHRHFKSNLRFECAKRAFGRKRDLWAGV